MSEAYTCARCGGDTIFNLDESVAEEYALEFDDGPTEFGYCESCQEVRPVEGS